ncbi:MAG: phage tail protein [Nitriliruptoraceae bacterium]
MTSTDHATSAPSYPPGWLVGQLPVGMRDDDLLVRFTTIFEQLGATLRAGADGIEHLLDPTVTTPPMLDAMARWLSYDVLDEQLDLAHQRRIVTAIGRSLAWRGTRRGLETLLGAIVDGWVQVDDPGAVGDGDLDGAVTGAVIVRVASTGHLQRHELEQLIRDEIPAHLDVQLVIAPRGGASRSLATEPR